MNLNLKQYFSLLRKYLLKELPSFISLIIVIVIGYYVALKMPITLGNFIDKASEKAPVNELYIFAFIYLGLIIVNQLLSILESYLSVNVGWKTTNNLRFDLTSHALILDISYHKKFTSGEFIERVDSDIQNLFNFFTDFITLILKNFGLAIFLIGYVLIKEWQLGLLLIISLLLSLSLPLIFNKKFEEYSSKEREANGKASGTFGEYITSIKEIRTTNSESFFHKKYTFFLKEQGKWDYKNNILDFNIGAIDILFSDGFVILGLIIIGLGFLSGKYSMGSAFIFFSLILKIQTPVNELRNQLTYIQQTKASIGRIESVLNEKPTIFYGENTMEDSSIELKNVSFSYVDDEPVLKNVTLNIKPGEILGIMGRTGSGKTTLARLLVRLYDIKEGSILIGKKDSKSLKKEEMINKISYVTQETEIFSGTLRDNLTLYKKISDDEILKLIDNLKIKPWFEGLKEGLNTKLSRDNPSMSSGELQLINIIRVFLKNPEIIILDEATANLDPVTEKYLENALSEILKDRTVVIIAHRLKTILRSHKILILQKGRMLEYGDKDELIKDNNSNFRQLLERGLEEVLV